VRKLLNLLVPALAGLCAVAAVTVLISIVAAIAGRGLPAIRWSFFTEQIKLVGAEGGIFFNLVGTLILMVTSLLIAAPLATGLALLHGVYLQSGKWKRRLTLLLYLLNGVPSILFGIFGLIVFVKLLGWGKSWLAGGILLGLMILPTVSVALMERIASLPGRYVEAAAGLGLNQSQIIWSVILPQCAGGLLTGSLLGLARAVGETAPIMFTATVFAGATLPHGIKENPVLSLPYHIFILAQDSFDPNVTAKLWGSALVLVGLVLSLSLAALPSRLRAHEEAHHG
jgi:phosphate transport system permease protein